MWGSYIRLLLKPVPYSFNFLKEANDISFPNIEVQELQGARGAALSAVTFYGIYRLFSFGSNRELRYLDFLGGCSLCTLFIWHLTLVEAKSVSSSGAERTAPPWSVSFHVPSRSIWPCTPRCKSLKSGRQFLQQWSKKEKKKHEIFVLHFKCFLWFEGKLKP